MSLNIASKYFIRSDVKNILQKLTGFDLKKIFAPKFNPDLKSSEIQLLTQRELQNENQKAIERAKNLLQMPPFLGPRQVSKQILSQDDRLNPLNLTNSNYMFIDISMDTPHDKRTVVVRETNGTLRKADYNEREKMLQVYFPEKGKSNYVPHMFESKNLEECLNMKHYLLVLNKACLKFEPNDPEFIRVTHRVYEYVNEMKDYEMLRSTRFFGPMAFYLAWYKKLENLTAFYLNESNINDCIHLVKLYCILHEKELQLKKYVNEKTTDLNLIELFIKYELNNSASAELAFKKFLDDQKENEKVAL